MANVFSIGHPPLLDADCALFLDVDGTLIEFAEHPALVHLLPQVRENIGQISDRLQGAVALVSGRPLAQLDALFAPLRLPAAGLHGHQLRHADTADSSDAQIPEWLHTLHQQAMEYAHSRPGVLIEDKGVSLALHWRMAPELGADVTRFARQHLRPDSGYRLQPGNHVIEFVPADSDKGKALTTLMRQPPFYGRRPVFIGDDLTDESGFFAAQQSGGWGVLVGARTGSHARYALPDIAAVHTWLQANRD